MNIFSSDRSFDANLKPVCVGCFSARWSWRSSRCPVLPGQSRRLFTRCRYSGATRESPAGSDESISVDDLCHFIRLNLGKWNGSFHHFDAQGNLLHKVSTKLSASSYGGDGLISLIQTLYIEQPQSSTSVSGREDKPEWAEYKITETTMLTVDKYQQTAGMLETVLRQGVLGEADLAKNLPNTSFYERILMELMNSDQAKVRHPTVKELATADRNLRLPSRRPSIVCENCLYSQLRDARARAFHMMDLQGVVDMLLVFLERRDDSLLFPSLHDDRQDSVDRIFPFLGSWKGRSVTKCSGVYGATIAVTDLVASLEVDDNGQLTQVVSTTTKSGEATTNVHWMESLSGKLATFDGGYPLTLLPSDVYMEERSGVQILPLGIFLARSSRKETETHPHIRCRRFGCVVDLFPRNQVLSTTEEIIYSIWMKTEIKITQIH